MITFHNASRTPRAGVKGPGAAAWLAGLGLPTPDAPNQWLPLEGGLIARLGITEFLIEGPASARCANVGTGHARDTVADRGHGPLLQSPGHGVYPVLRQDTMLVLQGTRLNDLLLETCSVNFLALDLATRPVLLTSIVGVGVTAIPGHDKGLPTLQLWCDSTYGDWLLETLTEVASELIQSTHSINPGAAS